MLATSEVAGTKRLRQLSRSLHPSGIFVWAIHKPRFIAENFRETDAIGPLGVLDDGSVHDNRVNFPEGSVEEPDGQWVYEVLNPFPFRGATYIIKHAADRTAEDPSKIGLPKPQEVSLSEVIKQWDGPAASDDRLDALFESLPDPVLLALAANATDPADLIRIAEHVCTFVKDPKTGRPVGLVFEKDPQGRTRARIKDHTLFEVTANNIHLPDDYKRAMVLKPGVQGGSEIVGEWLGDEGESRIYEYLRRNSYIPWGHYAANMADTAVRYRAGDLKAADHTGMRHLYYQRTYVRMAREMDLPIPAERRLLSVDELETLRKGIVEYMPADGGEPFPRFNSTLWGWNFGFDYAPSRYRLHASHQQIHQQYALIPGEAAAGGGDDISDERVNTFAYGDLVADAAARFRLETGKPFFDTYIRAIRNNVRMDERTDLPNSLIIYEDDHVILFVPKAQTSQWEVQLMTLGPVGNILEAGRAVRASIDRAMLMAVQALERMGARMVTHIECSKRFDNPDTDQRLIYCFLPKLPYSPGSFTEAQLRWINGHYPEDFAAACRMAAS